jgi:hypothetical protein
VTPEETLARVAKRVMMMDSSALMEWADLAAAGMQRQLDDFRRSPDESHLGEIQVALIGMGAVVDELGIRLQQAAAARKA